MTESDIFWQCSPGTVETQCLYPLRHNNKKKQQQKNYQDEDKMSTIDKKINSLNPFNCVQKRLLVLENNTWNCLIVCKQMTVVKLDCPC